MSPPTRPIAATPTPTMDAGLRRLSRAADQSRLWIGCAALLAVVGGERGRAAAVNGLASIGLASAVVNLVLKPLGDQAPAGPPHVRGAAGPPGDDAEIRHRGPQGTPRPRSPSRPAWAPPGRVPESRSASSLRWSPTRASTPACTTRPTQSPEPSAASRWRRWPSPRCGASGAGVWQTGRRERARDHPKRVTTRHTSHQEHHVVNLLPLNPSHPYHG